MAKNTTRIARQRRHSRVRKRVSGSPDQPRLCVFRSLGHIYGQIIDDTTGRTLAAASDLEPDLKGMRAGRTKVAMAELVGEKVAQRALAQNVKAVVFDRGGYKYHGRVKALAEGARKAGLQF